MNVRTTGWAIPVGLSAALMLFALTSDAQETLERSPNLTGGWVGYTGVFYVNLPYRFTTANGAGIVGTPTFDFGLGLSRQWLVGGRFAPQSTTVTGKPDEWEALVRFRALDQQLGGPIDAAVTAAFNGAAESVDGEVSLARWFGPVRALGGVRGMTAAFGDDARLALAGGAVVHVREGALPIALAGDVTSTFGSGERTPGWSLAIQVGAAFTTHTVSLFATNTPSSTLQGSSRGQSRTRFGFDFTVPVPVGRFLGWYVPRETAVDAVIAEPANGGEPFAADIRRYLFAPKTIDIRAGESVRWANSDAVVHTVASDDGAWNSGAIQPGGTWTATFTRPGRYLFHCGPHPYMKGVVIVRGPP